MKLETFKKLLDSARKIDKWIDDAYKIKIDLIDSDMSESSAMLLKIAVTEIYNADAYDWVTYYLYELPEILKSKKEDDEPYASYEDGTPIDISTDEKLWKFLEKDYKNKEDVSK